MKRPLELLSLLHLALVPAASSAFGVVPPRTTGPSGFGRRGGAAALRMAEGGPPQYDRRRASVLSNVEVGRGTYLIRVAAEDGQVVDYEPGHVLALEIRDPEAKEEAAEPVDEAGAAEDDGRMEGWMRGPYTVTRSDDATFDVLYRVVGKKTETFAAAEVGTELRFGGKFKVPILEGIDTTSDDGGLDRVVLISTGVGVGPQIGFVERALADPTFDSVRRIDLYAGFREGEDVCCADVLDALTAAHPDRFSWTAVLSSEVGRTSDEPTLSRVAAEGGKKSGGATHYHLVGNGSMVNEWKAGLEAAGVPEHRVTLEMYFNHKENARTEAVERIGRALAEEAVLAEGTSEEVSA